jgi:hypothetical protein
MDAQHLVEGGGTVQGGGLLIEAEIPTCQTPAFSKVTRVITVEEKQELVTHTSDMMRSDFTALSTNLSTAS